MLGGCVTRQAYLLSIRFVSAFSGSQNIPGSDKRLAHHKTILFGGGNMGATATTGVMEGKERFPNQRGEQWRNWVELLHWGQRLFPLADDSKTPRFKGWQTFEADTVALGSWTRHRWNAGLCTGELVVVDADSDESLKALYRRDIASTWIVKTRRGYHLYFRHPLGGEVRNRQGAIPGVDIRGHGGFVVAPGSVVKGHVYEWMSRAGEMPTYRPEWFPSTKHWETSSGNRCEVRDKSMRAAWSYISKIRSISGQGGHNACYQAVAWLRDCELTRDQAESLLIVWNMQNAEPPWSPKELQHKLDSVYGR